MNVRWFSLRRTVIRHLLLGSAAGLILGACASAPQAPPPPSPKPAVRQQPKIVDAKAQQHYYDLGLQYYSKESYTDAQEAFQEVVNLGPHTALGVKAQENLRKIEKILKTLDEMEKK